MPALKDGFLTPGKSTPENRFCYDLPKPAPSTFHETMRSLAAAFALGYVAVASAFMSSAYTPPTAHHACIACARLAPPPRSCMCRAHACTATACRPQRPREARGCARFAHGAAAAMDCAAGELGGSVPDRHSAAAPKLCRAAHLQLPT